MSLSTVLQCWRLSDHRHTFNVPASAQAIASAEAELGCPLPRSLREVFLFSDGLSLFSGNLNIYPLCKPGVQLSLMAVTSWLRDCGWPIPKEVVVFGDSGSDELFGLWLGDRNAERYSDPVVQIGAIFEPGCMALAATNLPSFLIAETSILLGLYGGRDLAIRDLGVPEPLLRTDSLDESAIRRWADPALPPTSADPYDSRLDADDLKRLLT